MAPVFVYVCDGNKALLAVQVSYDISNSKTRKREIAGLVLAARKTGCKKLLLLTDHQYEDIIHDGYDIAIRPAYDYLLQKGTSGSTGRVSGGRAS